ncbi:polysaccharide pyruvyl transferase family protein [Flavobacterium aestuarii]|uniref:polysaccharide pyruvyl transferase family protein n=1 Tax=Flavobacterium aestuarii TaxID=3149227 RepID=UPI0032B42471
MKKILIVNEGFSDNLGDQAIKKSMLKLFVDLGYEVDFYYYSKPLITSCPNYYYLNSSKKTSRLIQLRLKWKNNIILNLGLIFKNYLAVLKWYFKNKNLIKERIKSNEYHYVIIGGGQLINSSDRISPSLFSIAAFTWAKYTNKSVKLCFVGIGVAAKFNFFEFFLYKRALKKAVKIWVRDEFSKQVLSEKFQVVSEVIPDVAFYLFVEEDKIKNNLALVGIFSFHEYNVKHNKDKITIDSFYNSWVEKIQNLISLGYDVGLFYTTQTDSIESINFQEYLKANYGLDIPLLNANSLSDLNQIFYNASFVYSGRMHALILGMNQNCTVEAFLTSKKLSSFVKEYIESNKSPIIFKEAVFNNLNTFFKSE